ncbi:MAG TPA: prolipoprotein diacylglyceryl transferase family protein [Thermoanaerobaculia bacterium]
MIHSLFEILGYVAGVCVFVAVRRRRGDGVPDQTRAAIFAAAAAGALIGSRLLVGFEGKTIVGGLAGGLIGVELAKKILGVTRSTGDLFVLPLIAATSIGRIGCFLTGPLDHTAGNPTTLPWGIAMGDPVKRHPVALYEIAFLLLLAPVTEWVRQRSKRSGDAFAVFLASYFAFRLFVDFLKPDPPPLFLHLTAIQWACAGGLIYYALVFSNDERSAAVPLLRRRRVDLPDVLPQD